jgi:hypothetical protein
MGSAPMTAALRKWVTIAAIWLVACLVGARAQFFNPPMFMPQPAGGGSCAASTTFLARTSGLSPTETSAYDTMICGMISDGVGCSAWSGSSGNLDALYIFTTNNTTTASLNLCSSSFGITNNSLVFTADTYWAQNGGVTGYLDTGYVPSTASGNCTQNSCSAAVFNFIETGGTLVFFGGGDASNEIIFFPAFSNNVVLGINDPASGANRDTVNNTLSKGSWIFTRTASNVEILYRDGSATPFLSGSGASTGLPSVSQYILAYNNIGSAIANGNASITASFIGGGLSAANAKKISDRINTYMTTFSVNTY